MTIDDELLRAIAGYFLIRERDTWTGRRARLVVVLSLIRLGRELPPARVGQLSSAVFALGREVPSLPGITHQVPWDEEALSAVIQEALPSTIGLEEEALASLVSLLARRVRNASPNAIKLPAWIAIINQLLQQTECEDANLSLEDKLALSNVIEDILAARLETVVAAASEQAGVPVADIVQRLAAATATEPERASASTPSARPSSDPQVTATRLDALRPRVHPDQHAALEQWFATLNDRLQRAVVHGVERAAARPFDPSRTRAIKLGTSTFALRELKVQSRKLHLRILFRTEPFEILSFGLRRDLDDLIVQACRVVER